MAITALVAGSAAASAATLFGITSLAALAAIGLGAAAVFDYVMDSMMEDIAVDTMGGRNVTKKDSTASRKIVYGTVRTGGTIVYQSNNGENNKYLHNVIAFSEGELEEISEIYFEEVKAMGLVNGQIRYYNKYSSNEDGSASATGNHLSIELATGASADQAITTLASETGNGQWSSQHDLSKIAHAYIRLEYSDEIYTNGFPKITAIIKGKKLYDPRQDSTATAYSGSGSQRINDTSTWEYSNNSAVCLLNYMLDDRIGLGESLDAFDATSLKASMDDCDVDISLAAGGTQKKYTSDGIIDSNNSHKANIQNILTSMNGQLLYSGGKYHVKSYNYETPHSQVVTEDMIIGNIDIATKASRRSLYNRVKGKFVSEEDNYVMTEYPAQIYYTAGTTTKQFEIDDGETLYHEYSLPMTTNNVRAQRLARLTMLRSRMQSSIKFTTNAKGLLYTVGDNIKVTNSTIGITEKIYQIQRLNVRPDAEKGLTVDIEAKENVDSFYNWSTTDELSFTSGLTVSLFDGAVSKPSNLVLEPYYENGLSKIRATWTASTSQGDIIYKVYYKRNTSSARSFFESYTYENFIEINLSEFYEGKQLQVVVQAMRQASGVVSDSLTGLVKAAKVVKDNPNNIVRGNIVNPTPHDISVLCANAGIPVDRGLEVTYLQLNDSGDVLSSQDFVFESMTLTPITQKVNNDIISESFNNLIVNGDFSNTDDWLITDGGGGTAGLIISDGKLNLHNHTSMIFALQVVSNIAIGKKHKLSFDIVGATSFPQGEYSVFILADMITTDQILQFRTIDSDRNLPEYNDITQSGTYTAEFVASTEDILFGIVNFSSSGGFAYDNISLTREDEKSEHSILLSLPPSVTSNVTWSYSYVSGSQVTSLTTGNSIGMIDPSTGQLFSGVSTTLDGFDDSKVVNKRKSVEVGVARESDATGFSQIEVEVTASWTQPIIFAGVTVNVPKTASEVVLLSARVR